MRATPDRGAALMSSPAEHPTAWSRAKKLQFSVVLSSEVFDQRGNSQRDQNDQSAGRKILWNGHEMSLTYLVPLSS